MSGISLSSEICSRIVDHISGSRVRDLWALCLTCKAFQAAAEIKLYSDALFHETETIRKLCWAVTNNPRYGPLIHRFCIYDESSSPVIRPSQSFWVLVQKALAQMHNLQYLALSDASFTNTWIFNSEALQFQLTAAHLYLSSWDAALANFLASQKKLSSLYLFEHQEQRKREGVVGTVAGITRLPSLKIFEGPLTIAIQLIESRCSLTHIQAPVRSKGSEQLSEILPALAKAHKTLSALNLLQLSPEQAVSTVDVISRSCPTLQHLGVISLPHINRHEIYASFMRMHHLIHLELDVFHWDPHPNNYGQRALVSEIRIYCPTIRVVVFWCGRNRYFWQCRGDEIHKINALDYFWTMA